MMLSKGTKRYRHLEILLYIIDLVHRPRDIQSSIEIPRYSALSSLHCSHADQIVERFTHEQLAALTQTPSVEKERD